MPTTKLYLGNLPEDASKEDLLPMFEKYGKVVEFDILKDYGFIHFEVESEANAAAAALDQTLYNNVNIKVEVSRSKVRQKAGMGGKGECYRCGGDGHWSKECPRGPSSRGGFRGGRGSRGGRGDGRPFGPYGRPPPRDFYEDFDYFQRSRMMAAYDRFRSFDPYERRPLPPMPPPGRDPYARPGPDYYNRRSPPRDPYYDYYERRSLSNSGAAEAGDDSKYAPQRTSNGGSATQGRVPGPY